LLVAHPGVHRTYSLIAQLLVAWYEEVNWTFFEKLWPVSEAITTGYSVM
jgi:hypothetical protein